jgi:hypothetical protein
VIELGKKYLVCGDTQFYPWIYEFDSLEEAQKEYAQSNPYEETVYLCEVITSKKE